MHSSLTETRYRALHSLTSKKIISSSNEVKDDFSPGKMNKRKEKKGLAPSPQITPSVSAQG